jgi:hypothetical protein
MVGSQNRACKAMLNDGDQLIWPELQLYGQMATAISSDFESIQRIHLVCTACQNFHEFVITEMYSIDRISKIEDCPWHNRLKVSG